MITWSDLKFPALNLWNYPNWRNVPETGTFVPKLGTFVRGVKHIHGVSIEVIYKDKK